MEFTVYAGYLCREEVWEKDGNYREMTENKYIWD